MQNRRHTKREENEIRSIQTKLNYKFDKDDVKKRFFQTNILDSCIFERLFEEIVF